MTLSEVAETTVDHGARGRENDSNGQNSHYDGKERVLVREKGRRKEQQREGKSRDATLFRKRSCCKRGGVFFLFVLAPFVFFLFESCRGHLSSSTATTRKEKETLTTAKKIESLSRKNAEITRRRARDEETLTAKVVADLSRKNEKMTPRRSARRASFSEMINDNVKDVRATRVKEIGDVEGSLLVVPTNDEYMGKYMLESGKVWEEHVLSRMLDYVRVNSNVVDVGANYGSYSVYFSKKVGRGGTVTSFEPQPYLNRICSTNLVLNDIQNVKLEQTSLGHAEITTEMSSKLSDGASTSQDFQTALDENKLINYGGRQIGVGGESITMKTLDSFKITNLSLLKVDAEGSEPLVFWGAKETIAREKPVIFGEDKQKLPLAALNAMKVKDEVRRFDVRKWAVEELGYTVLVPNGWTIDFILLPP